MAAETIRESVIAGSWYPDHPQTLRGEIERYMGQAQVSPLDGDLIGLIAPHAGYAYSGGVAAHAYSILQDKGFHRVLIVAPSHRAYFKGASIYNLGGYRTPLGVVPLDHELIDALMKQTVSLDYVPQAHSQEHSLEIQLPFLQVVLKDFRLTPIVMGDQSYENCSLLAEAVSNVCRNADILLIASSDLSHFHSYEEAKRLDRVLLDHVEAFRPSELSRDLRAGNCEACGGGPILTLMLAAHKLGANKARILQYANSGDVTGDKRGVVGYMAAALYRNPEGKNNPRHRRTFVGVDLGLSQEEKEILKRLAFEAIRSRCLHEQSPPVDIPAHCQRLSEPRGAFVCLHKGENLRGCIGMIEGRDPLHQTVRSMAVQAAFADPRFCALDASELEQIDLEISVLTPLERIEDPSQIKIGRHGLVVRKGYNSGLLLPQVPAENGWDRTEFLEWTCRKAGLPPDAWEDEDVQLYVFSADVF